jgi:hypothetical protein
MIVGFVFITMNPNMLAIVQRYSQQDGSPDFQQNSGFTHFSLSQRSSIEQNQ